MQRRVALRGPLPNGPARPSLLLRKGTYRNCRYYFTMAVEQTFHRIVSFSKSTFFRPPFLLTEDLWRSRMKDFTRGGLRGDGESLPSFWSFSSSPPVYANENGFPPLLLLPPSSTSLTYDVWRWMVPFPSPSSSPQILFFEEKEEKKAIFPYLSSQPSFPQPKK